MGSLTSCFKSIVPPPLTTNEINLIKMKTNLSNEEIEQWHLRFLNCYPYGYLNEKEFVNYYQQLRDEHSQEMKLLIKDLFNVFDLNNDQKLDFNEFILMNCLTNNGSIYDKVQLIFNLYSNDKDKDKQFTKCELKILLRNLFDLFDIPYSKSNIVQIIDYLFRKSRLKKDQKINWKLFRDEILNDQSLYQQLLTTDFYKYSSQVIQRSERF